MAWTAPKTWTTGSIVTASDLNTYVRDDFLETVPAKVTTAGDIVVATGANTIKRVAVGNPGSVPQVIPAGSDIEFNNTLEILSLMEV